MLTKEMVKEYAKSCGADIVGVSSMDRFEGAPKQMDPRYIFPDAKAMVVLGFRIPRGTLRGIEEGTFFSAYSSMGYAAINFVLQPMTLWKMNTMFEEEGYEAVPIANHWPWTNTHIFGENPELTGEHREEWSRPVSEDKPAPDVCIHMRIAAYCAGLGEIGYSKVFLTPQFGPRQRFAAILTDAPLTPDPLYDGPALCDKCMLCAKDCTGHAISTTETVKVTVAGKELEWGKIDYDKCGRFCFGASKEHNPFMVTPEDEEGFNKEGHLNDYKVPPTYSYGRAIEGARGCIRACMVHLEKQDKLENKFKNPFRKKKQWRL